MLHLKFSQHSAYVLRILCPLIVLMVVSLTAIPRVSAGNYEEVKPTSDKRVVMISLPRLTWKNYTQVKTPNIDEIIARGSAATLSVRVLGSRLSPSKGYATLSSGNRSTAVDSETASFVNPSETYSNQDARDLFEAQRGKLSINNPAALGLSFELSLEANRKSLDQSEIGSFAKGLDRDSKSIAVFGNADDCLTESQSCFERSVAYVGVNSNGVMRFGDISRELLLGKDELSGPRPTLNYTVMGDKVKDSIKKHDVTVAECSDLERIDADRRKLTVAVYEKDFNVALSDCDAFIGSVMTSLDLSKDQIYVFSPSPPREKEETTFFASAGKGIEKGYASSSTTRIKGAVTLVDIAPSILDFLGSPVPDAMNGALLDWRKSSDSIQVRQDFLLSMNDRAVARDETLKPTVWFIIFVFILAIILSMIFLSRENRWMAIARFFALLTASLPLMTFVLQPAMIWLSKPFRFIVVLSLLSILLALILYVLAKKFRYPKILLALSSLYLIVEIGDILTGGHLQFNSIFGNATLVAGRFSGFNNQSFAILAASMILFVAMVKQVFNPQDMKKTHQINVMLVIFMAFVLVVDGAPRFGSDVGGVLALTPTIFVISMMLFEKRVGIRSLIASGMVTFVTIATFAFIDLSRPEEKRTHLGRFAEQLFNGEAGLVIERKFTASLRSFTRLDVTLLVIVGVLYLLFLSTHNKGLLKSVNARYLGFKFIAYPGLFLCILGTLLNDSGVTIPALMMLIGIPAVTLLVIENQTEALSQSPNEPVNLLKDG